MKRKVKLLIESNGMLLLLKPLHKEKYTLIGGTVEQYETPIDAAIREGFEEAGLALELSDFGTYFTRKTLVNSEPAQFYCYLLQKENLVFELKEHHKFQSLNWVPINEGISRLKGLEKHGAKFFQAVLFFNQNNSKQTLTKAI